MSKQKKYYTLNFDWRLDGNDDRFGNNPYRPKRGYYTYVNGEKVTLTAYTQKEAKSIVKGWAEKSKLTVRNIKIIPEDKRTEASNDSDTKNWFDIMLDGQESW